jgi:RND family efflux transporter MFP subunit
LRARERIATFRAVSDEDRLANELASLKIERDRPRSRADGNRRSGVPGWVVGALVVGALGTAGFFVFREGKGRIFPDEVELGAVGLMSPAQADVTLVATGYVYARKKATVAPKVAGRLARLYADETSVVKEGQVIAELESADAQAQLAQVRADIAAARAKVERARADVTDSDNRFQREDTLLKKGAGTQAAYDDAKLRLSMSRTALSSAEADVHAVEARHQAVTVALENTKVRAPFAGTVIRKIAEIGEVVTPTSQQGILTIASLDDLEVQADVSEAQFSKVRVGTPTEILLDAFADKRFRGAVSEIRPTVDRAKASVTVKVRFTDDSRGVLPDMAAKVSFLAKALDEQALKAAPKVVAPADAVATRNGRQVLFTIEDGHARELVVALGPQIGTQVELTSGPGPGTQVIRNPPADLRDGQPVKEKKK